EPSRAFHAALQLLAHSTLCRSNIPEPHQMIAYVRLSDLDPSHRQGLYLHLAAPGFESARTGPTGEAITLRGIFHDQQPGGLLAQDAAQARKDDGEILRGHIG